MLHAGHDGADPAPAKESMRLMAEDVLPAFNHRIAGKARQS